MECCCNCSYRKGSFYFSFISDQMQHKSPDAVIEIFTARAIAKIEAED